MKKSNITIGFDGNALKEHKIDAVDLAIALTGFNELLEFANKTLNGDNIKLKIQVNSDFQKGSFNILIDLTQTISGLFQGVEIKDILTYVGFVSGVAGIVGVRIADISLIDLFRKLKNNTVIQQENNGNIIVITLADGTKIEVKKEIMHLMSVPEIRKALAVMLTPLNTDGIDNFYTYQNEKQKEQIIKKEEIDTFIYTEPKQIEEEEIFDISTNRMVCKIIGVVFEENLKWKLADDNNKFYANVVDEDFLKKINDREVNFSKGDLLKADIEIKTFKNKENIRKEYIIKKVIEVIQPKKIQQLTFDIK